MAPTRHMSEKKQLESSTRSADQSLIPNNGHLLITTSHQICTWDYSGIHTIFHSSKNGIVAARGAQDESGLLTVADKHVVVLHDTKRGREQSWGLEATGDEVRHLEYVADAKSLFLSTNLTNDIQQYSTERARLLSPARTHSSPPIALAVSPTGHLMVSASDGPPVVYLKNLVHQAGPVLIEPRASKFAVSVAAFHPQRPNIFLLAFRDGTLAAYDSTKVIRAGNGSLSDQELVNKGEISHLTALHRAAPIEDKRVAITGAAFLPGFKTRAVSVGSDGRCRLIDFADGGVILRTWHAKAPVTSVSVFQLPEGAQTHRPSAGTTAARPNIKTPSADSLIAVGRTDGMVHVYDSLGLLLSQQRASEAGEKIISVEWISGPSPKPIVEKSISSLVIEPPLSFPSQRMNTAEEARAEQTSVPGLGADKAVKCRRDTMFEHVGLPPELRKPNAQSAKQTASVPPRQFTIHPDEIDEGTVKHTPLLARPTSTPLSKGDFFDLFSPVKSMSMETAKSPEKRVTSPPRSRPAVTNQTFIKSPEPTSTAQYDTMARQRNIALFPSTDSDPDRARPSITSTRAADQKIGAGVSPSGQKRRIKFRESSCRNSRRASTFKTTAKQPNHNAKILADLRKMGAINPLDRSNNTLSSTIPADPALKKTNFYPRRTENKLQFKRRPVDHIETHHDSDTAREIYEHAHERRHWPEDSNQDTSMDDDIWLTSGSNKDMKRSQHRQKDMARWSARQTSRSRVSSAGATRTTAQQSANPASTSAPRMHRMDGSTEEEMYTAESHVTSNGTLSPSSKDVRELFPRSSSLSPRKRQEPKLQPLSSLKSHAQSLREIAPNAVYDGVSRNPWERARAGKGAQSCLKKSTRKAAELPIRVFEDQVDTTGGSESPPKVPHCAVCGPTSDKVQKLEAEIAHLKAEILVFKTVLRRQGVPAHLHTLHER